MNRHVKTRRSPRFRFRVAHPYVEMVVPLAAYRVWSMISLRPRRSLRGKTHRSDPVSARYRCLVTRSVTKRGRSWWFRC